MATPYRYVTPVTRAAATGQVAAVYRQSRRELGALFSPHLAPVPPLHVATWALLRESLLAGSAPRARKEAVAAAVSVANRCPFCVDAHTSMLHAAGEHRLADAVLRGETPDDPADAALVEWALASRAAGAEADNGAVSEYPSAHVAAGGIGTAMPFPPEHAAEYLGTVLVNHFINRMIDALRPGSMLPGNALAGPARRLAGMALASRVRRPLRPGESLPLLPAGGQGTPPAWAQGSPIGSAYAAFHACAHEGGALLGDSAREAVTAAVSAWDGGHPELGTGWLDDAVARVPESDRAGVRLALLAAIAPYRLTDAAVARWRGTHPEDADLVRVLAFGAVTAVDRIATGLTADRADQDGVPVNTE